MKRFFLLALAVAAMGPGAAMALGGSLDPVFGSNGLFTWQAGGGGRYASLATAADGGTFVAGRDALSLVVRRFGPDGGADLAYGSGGIARADLGSGFSDPVAVGLPDGKLLAFSVAAGELAAVRLTASGVPDPTFASRGLRRISLGAPYPCAPLVPPIQKLVPVPDGGWLLAIGADGLSPCRYLLRLTAEASIDRNFADGGVAPVGFRIYDLRITPVGVIEVLGSLDSRTAIVVGKWTAAGRPAPEGPVMPPITINASDLGFGGFAPDGARVLVKANGQVQRITADDRLDLAFGDRGVASLPFYFPRLALRVFPLADGGILVQGVSAQSSNLLFAKVDAGGRLDPSFGPGGFAEVAVPNPGRFPRFTHGVMQPDGYLAFMMEEDSSTGHAARLQVTDDVVEFYNTLLDHYFLTADGSEALGIDRGAAGPGWTRSGRVIRPGGGTSVCRFYGTPGRGPNSHFFTADPGECEQVKRDPGWTFEGLGFHTVRPAAGACAAGLRPVHRLYNNRWRENDSNHRFTTDTAIVASMAAGGWVHEGVVSCARP